jgi:hypothetical protein
MQVQMTSCPTAAVCSARHVVPARLARTMTANSDADPDLLGTHVVAAHTPGVRHTGMQRLPCPCNRHLSAPPRPAPLQQACPHTPMPPAQRGCADVSLLPAGDLHHRVLQQRPHRRWLLCTFPGALRRALQRCRQDQVRPRTRSHQVAPGRTRSHLITPLLTAPLQHLPAAPCVHTASEHPHSITRNAPILLPRTWCRQYHRCWCRRMHAAPTC